MQTKPPRKRKRWLRWVFALIVVAATIFLVYVTTTFFREAQTSIGPTPISGSTLDAMLTNRKQFEPPNDGRLRISQVHVCLRITELIDSLDRRQERKDRMRLSIASVMNSHMQSRASYTWIRTRVSSALLRSPQSHADSADVSLIRMMRPRLHAVERVLTDTLDRELLK